MSDQQINWTSFRKRIFIDRSIEEVYQAWATPSKLTEWFLEKADYKNPDNTNHPKNELIQANDNFSWKWHNWEIHEEGKVLSANNKDKISFSFGKAGNVNITLTNIGTRTEVDLVQDKIPTDEKSQMNYYVGCSTGWTFWLTNLKAWLEYGIKLNATGLTQSEVHDLVNS